jgi:glyoxylase-like metal-dependent hydrolase (beta-lactamase superfamily II)
VIRNLAQGQRGFTSNAFLVAGAAVMSDGADRGEPAEDPAGRTVLVDSGSEFDVVAAVERFVDDLDAVVLTHTHPDHVGNTADVIEAFDVDVWGFEPDHRLVDHRIADGDTVELGAHSYDALHTPGHKEDHLCFHAPDAGVLFAGDLIFAGGSFGRTDLPEGDHGTLVASIERVLETVGPDLCEMHTGHGPSVTDSPFQQVQLSARAARSMR